jgi:hypothetical protein
MSLVFDEYGRPFIIIKDQGSKSRLKGIAALKVPPLRPASTLLLALPAPCNLPRAPQTRRAHAGRGRPCSSTRAGVGCLCGARPPRCRRPETPRPTRHPGTRRALVWFSRLLEAAVHRACSTRARAAC